MKLIRFHVWNHTKDRRDAAQIQSFERLEEKRRAVIAAMQEKASADAERREGAKVLSILTRKQAD